MKEKILKHKVKIILVVLAAIILSVTYSWGGNFSKWPVHSQKAAIKTTQSKPASISKTQAADPKAGASPSDTISSSQKADKNDAVYSEKVKTGASTKIAKSPAASAAGSASSGADAVVSQKAKMNINPITGKDQYQTNPVPSGKPVPVEPQKEETTDQKLTCTLTVSCKTVLEHMDLLDKNKWELIPKDGIIFAKKAVTFYQGENVFNVLQREMKKAGIQMESKNTPLYNSQYIEGINNIYEFDVGELSGWTYQVNGWFPNYGSSRYQLKNGDDIIWEYTCDLGKDIGGNNSTGS